MLLSEYSPQQNAVASHPEIRANNIKETKRRKAKVNYKVLLLSCTIVLQIINKLLTLANLFLLLALLTSQQFILLLYDGYQRSCGGLAVEK